LYCQGKHSSDEEELDDVPDDDQYDTDDSFIDDAELVSYPNFCFSYMDKHIFFASGYFLVSALRYLNLIPQMT
jgi:hypothetical protein